MTLSVKLTACGAGWGVISVTLSDGLRAVGCIAVGSVVGVTGLCMLAGGIQLTTLGGSWYFASAGLGLVAAGFLIARRHPAGAAIYMIVFAATIVWSLWDAGPIFWPLFSRLVMLAALAVPVLLLAPAFRSSAHPAPWRLAYGAAAALVVALAATLYLAFQPHPSQTADAAPAPRPGRATGAVEGGDWRYWGRTPSGTRHAPLDQITPGNVTGLEIAWTYRTGEIPKNDHQAHVVTPLYVNGALYGCTQSSRLFALDAETGKQIWVFDPKTGESVFPRCRGVGYHDERAAGPIDGQSSQAMPACTRRIIATTIDARLLAVDALTGLSCSGFGENGTVSLRVGMGRSRPEFYFPTAAPTVTRDLIIVGGLVWDDQELGEPSGVVRAFDVRTGALVWAWDLGNPAITGLPPEGKSYTPGTPNVWSTPAFDEALGLVYLPTGNATPDFWGGHRTEADDRYSSSVVALDIATGRERWRFQTVRHDLWDYDVPSQPALYDVPDGKGGTIPVLIQTTKHGQIFMLDRRDGRSVTEVVDRPVPQGGVADERVAATQPFSIGMPALGAEPLSERRMWGLTPLDQMVCRIRFRQARYEGTFTPPNERWTIQYPGWFGGANWGSNAIAENLGYLIVNDSRFAMMHRLVPRAEYDARIAASGGHGGGNPQRGTPWGADQNRFLSPLRIPCHEPPYGTINAIDLATRQLVWSMPLGTIEETGPRDIPTRLPIPIGMPSRGGPITTSSGVVFIAASQDSYLRALDVRTGRELWKGRLPVGAETTPMTYMSPSGRQFVIISAGGHSATPAKGDYVVAFALRR
ncbi:MAG TPA: membrane-bound PQQ-dependent dehydrogenase, glucose/quinate/shikimate family [Bosea sp. (in: a-proteobacteria)]|jgi:quinate dehydrogenase (quinone)|uniref:membrane-bound PQQ-dependent dehydrogenase, glucose/quinate/shikimate family n=1 Tax=Bosea sp. (in: a-proteobacteria) TaxID=1871050 RepID=UPI002E165A16|nr:membrane-bound PQQ-dependent dehydrogenase, glucose/quinate/shikimate family [Bosea sp. (in: a-proteobacteria)]